MNTILTTKKGFTLVGMMVGVGLLSALVLGFAEFMRGSLAGQQKLMQIRDTGDLQNEMGILLDSESNCRVSLAGEGKFTEPTAPFTFKKSAIDGKDDEGQEVELWLSDQAGTTRIEKMFYAKKEYSLLTIESIKLLMDSPKTSGDYSQSDGHEDIGTLKVTVKNLDNTEQKFDIKLSVFMKTEGGETTLYSCSRESSVRRCGEDQKWTPNCGCATEGEVYNRAMAGVNDPEFTCQSLICKKEEKWHDICGCLSLEEHEKIKQNPDQSNPCDQEKIAIFTNVKEGTTELGPYKFCAISMVWQNQPCKKSGLRNRCEVRLKNNEDIWEVEKRGASPYIDECHALGCNVVCVGGSGVGNCKPPQKMVDGHCIHCLWPKRWYGNVCDRCNDGYSHKCGKCKVVCPPESYCSDGTGGWSDKTCSCSTRPCPEPGGGEGGEAN